MKRKVLAIFLIVTMLFSLAPTAALAADTSVDYTLVFFNGKVYQDGDISDNGGGTSTFGAEMPVDELAKLGITTGSGYTYTFNGVDFKTSASTAIKIMDGSATIVLKGENRVTGGDSHEETTIGIDVVAGSLSIIGTDEDSLTVTAGNAGYYSYGLFVNNKLNISGKASVTGTGGAATYDGESYGIYAYDEISIEGGTVVAETGTATYGCAIASDIVSITGGEVTADATASTNEGYALEFWNNANISGGIVILQASTYASAYWTSADGDVAAAPSTEGMAVTAGESSDGSDAKVLSNWNDDGSDDVSKYKYMKFEPSGSVGGEEDDEDDDEDTTSSTSDSGGFSGSYNYPITISPNDNGSAILSDSNAVAGETVTITTDPDAGYGVSEVVVTDKDGNAIEVTALGNGQYTFVMSEGGADVQVVYKPAIVLTVGSLYIDVFGKLVKNDVTAILTPEGRMMLPIRVIAEALGADVDWDPDLQKVTITKGDTIIEIFIGAEYAYVNGEKVALDSAAFIKDNRTYLPVRFVSEYLGADVNWYAGSKTVTIVPYDVK